MPRFLEGPDLSDSFDELKSEGHGPLPTKKVEPTQQSQEPVVEDQSPSGDSQAF
jgi:hypothetical protein